MPELERLLELAGCRNGASTLTLPWSFFSVTVAVPDVPSLPVTVQSNVAPSSAVWPLGQDTDLTLAPVCRSTICAMNVSAFFWSIGVPVNADRSTVTLPLSSVSVTLHLAVRAVVAGHGAFERGCPSWRSARSGTRRT